MELDDWMIQIHTFKQRLNMIPHLYLRERLYLVTFVSCERKNNKKKKFKKKRNHQKNPHLYSYSCKHFIKDEE